MSAAVQLEILSGGAAQGLVQALSDRFKVETGCEIAGTFGAVGAMRDKLIGGAPADLLILTAALIAELTGSGHVVAGTAQDIGIVYTAIAVRAGNAVPSIGDAEALRSALLAADEIHFADPKLATAGIHFAKVLAGLGLGGDAAAKLRTHPNGLTAMRTLAQSRGKRPIGCTQVTEVLSVQGVTLAGPLPKPFELATLYTAGVCTRARLPAEARRFAALLAGGEARAVRQSAGFEAVG
jgi:molybdate transport system substrate-binding protein